MNVVFIGHDAREQIAYEVCEKSLRAHAKHPVAVQPISSSTLGSAYYRPQSQRGAVRWDELSNAPMSTEFAIARFFVPTIHRNGWALFCDCDFLWRAPVDELFALADDQYAVMVVKHAHRLEMCAKMDGQIQLPYPRKNWSSLVLWNCGHPATQRLTLRLLNSVPGLYLHQFTWLSDDQIGGLPLEWNWLEGINAPLEPKAVHFTRGIPAMAGYENSAFAAEWWSYASR